MIKIMGSRGEASFVISTGMRSAPTQVACWAEQPVLLSLGDPIICKTKPHLRRKITWVE